MRRILLLPTLMLGAAAVVAGPAGSGGVNPPPPDGVLVLGVGGYDPGSRVVTREQAVVADPGSGALRTRRLAGGALCHGPVLAIGGHVVFSGHRGNQPVARELPLTLTGPARSLGRADAFAPSATPGRVWLARWRASPGRLRLRELDAGGRLRSRATATLPRFGLLHAATSDGFVGSSGRWLTLLGNGRGRPLWRVRDGWFVAADRSRFAWCRGGCRALHVWSARGDRLLRPPSGLRPLVQSAAFSPDGLRLAVGVTARGRARVAVIELATGRWTLVPGGRLGGYDAIAWSPSGRWLYFTAGNRRLSGWRFGARRALRLPIEPAGTVMSIAVAPTPR